MERFPIESAAGRHFRLALRVKADEKLAVREKQVINYFTQCKFGHIGQRILDETKRRGQVENMDYHIGVNVGADDATIKMKAQKHSFPKAQVWRAKRVGAYVRCDAKTIPLALAKHTRVKYMVVFKDSFSRAVVRYYLHNLKNLAQTVRKYRHLLKSKGHNLCHFQADGQFWTDELGKLGGEDAHFDYSFSTPHCQSEDGLAEADIKKNRYGCQNRA